MNVNEQDEKSASEASSAEPRAGGPVITKGQSHRSDDAGAEALADIHELQAINDCIHWNYLPS